MGGRIAGATIVRAIPFPLPEWVRDEIPLQLEPCDSSSQATKHGFLVVPWGSRESRNSDCGEDQPMPDDWMARLKAACDAGYYKTEASEGQQMSFPWQTRASRLSLLVRLLGIHIPRLRTPWNRSPVCCVQCGRLFSTMTQGVRRMHRVWCGECYRSNVRRAPTLMAPSGHTQRPR